MSGVRQHIFGRTLDIFSTIVQLSGSGGEPMRLRLKRGLLCRRSPSAAFNPAADRSEAHEDASKRGYSLLEILIVLTIIGLIAAFVGPRLFSLLDHSKVTTARVQVRALESALETMRLDIGRYPTATEGLKLLVEGDPKAVVGWRGPYLGGALPQDPWGHPYAYQSPASEEAPAKVFSYGSDGKPGGSGDAADIYNNAGV